MLGSTESEFAGRIKGQGRLPEWVPSAHRGIFSSCPSSPPSGSKVNSGHWVMMMCQCSFTSDNKWPTLVGVLDNGGLHAGVETGCIGEISVPSMQVCFELTTALKNKIY